MNPIDICVVGPTASGKTALGVAIARQFGSEIISADAMQVYRRMDIGTAKPTVDEQHEVPHHLLDVVDPNATFTVVDFQRRAFVVRDELHSRAQGAVIVGGTGLYVRSYVDELEFPGRFPEVAAEIEAEPNTLELHRRLAGLDPVAADRMESNNRRRVVRALEVTIGSGRLFSSFGPGLGAYPERPHVVQLGIELPRERLDQRIEDRFHNQMQAGFLDEVADLADELVSTSAQALGYKELLAHIRGDVTLDEAVAEAVMRIRRFARRQQRWFRRDPRVIWIDGELGVQEQLEQAKSHVEQKRSASNGEHGNLGDMTSHRGTDCAS